MRILLPLLMAWVAAAQPDASKPGFEVASVKPSPRDPGSDRIVINLGTAQHGTVTLANTTLSECVRWAYGLSSEEQISGPDWIRDRAIRFDITAKAPPDTPLEQLQVMAQRLLAERFQLRLHREQKPITHLVLTASGKGPKPSESQAEGPSTLRESGRGHIFYDHLLIDRLAMLLSRQMRQTVVNRTGLPGYYDIDLHWTPEGVEASDTQEYPEIYLALQEQLGLKLEKSKAPLEVLVIDSAEKAPVGN